MRRPESVTVLNPMAYQCRTVVDACNRCRRIFFNGDAGEAMAQPPVY